MVLKTREIQKVTAVRKRSPGSDSDAKFCY